MEKMSQDCWRESTSIGETSPGHEAGGLVRRGYKSAAWAHQGNGGRHVGVSADGLVAGGF